MAVAEGSWQRKVKDKEVKEKVVVAVLGKFERLDGKEILNIEQGIINNEGLEGKRKSGSMKD